MPAMSNVPSITGTFSDSITKVVPLPLAISKTCPMSPKPVTSVQALTSTCAIPSAASRLSVFITFTALSTTSFSSKSAFIAVERIPLPRGFVKINTSPGIDPEFVMTFSGCTNPVTESPYLGSSSSTEWPPIKSAPASFTLSAPPFSISPSIFISRYLGNPTMFIAITGFPPIAYTSLSEFVAAICPKR